MMRTIGITAALLGALLGGAPRALAHNFAGSNELDGMIGGQIGVHDSPGGAKLFNEYGYRFSQIAWLNLQLNFAFGGSDRDCFVNRAGFVECGAFNGQALELIAGAKFKFSTRHERLVPYAKVGGGLAFIFFPGPDNDGVAPVFRGGGGVKYYVAPVLAVGGEMDMEFGPGFFGCGRSCTDTTLYFGIDIAGGIEFNF